MQAAFALDRRQCLGLFGSLFIAAGAATAATSTSSLGKRRLILLSLAGGNDGLNTLVPYRDPLYQALRPRVALPRERLLPLDDELALHPALGTVASLYEAGELAIVQDVGYPKPRLSHFESTAIWDSADIDKGLLAREGWWAEVVRRNAGEFAAAQLDAAAISFCPDDLFATGPTVPLLRVRRDLSSLFSVSRPALAADALVRPGVPGQLADLMDRGERVRARLAARLQAAPRPRWPTVDEAIEMQVLLADWLLTQDVRSPVLRLMMDGFDTHSELPPRHGRLLTVLDSSLKQLSQRLRAAGLWRDTLIVVSSEFGRRPRENAGAGTDHGTAGPVLLAGGAVRGGIYGPRAALDRLDVDGNLHHGTDFRSLYATLVDDWFGLPVNPLAERGHARLGGLLAQA